MTFDKRAYAKAYSMKNRERILKRLSDERCGICTREHHHVWGKLSVKQVLELVGYYDS